MLGKTFLKRIKEKMQSDMMELTKKSTQTLDIDTEGDETDEIQGNMLIEIQNQLNSRNLHKLSQISSAFKRLEDFTYGVCEDCEEDIPEKRLMVNPYFLTCVACAEARERENKHGKKL